MANKDCDSKFLCKLLEEAEGRSQAVIAVFVDVRGFSEFSTSVDSVEVAWFLKRMYHLVLTEYFPNAEFCKPTGDGLLIVLHYKDTALRAVANMAAEAALRLSEEFEQKLADDEVLTFNVPTKIGVSLTRGTACEIVSGARTIDYSGKLLNYAARLNEVCRPYGVILDGTFARVLEPSTLTSSFSEHKIYLRSVAEDNPVGVLTSHSVELPHGCFSAMSGEEWTELFNQDLTIKQARIKGARYSWDLPADYKVGTDFILDATMPSYVDGKKISTQMVYFDLRFKPVKAPGGFSVMLNFENIAERAEKANLNARDKITLVGRYQKVPIKETK